MNSIIVLDSDSSDLEDEAPSKKMRISRSIPATITAIKPGKTVIAATSTVATKTAKFRIVPTGTTITRQNTINILKESSISASSSSSSTGVGKRKTPTPPQRSSSSGTPPQSTSTPLPNSSNAIVNKCTISLDDNRSCLAVQSMTASTTPPLQLLATPPPPSQSSGTSFTDSPMMLNAQLLHSNLPESTTITLRTSPTNITSSSNNNNNHCHNNNNNSDFKIHLPTKRAIPPSTPSPAVSPKMKTPSSPSATSLSASPTNECSKSSKCNNNNNEKLARRIKPITVLKNSDEGWLQRHQQRTGETTVQALVSSKKLSTPPLSPAITSARDISASVMLDLTETSENMDNSVIMLDSSPILVPLQKQKSFSASAGSSSKSTASSEGVIQVKLNGERNSASATTKTLANASSRNAATDHQYNTPSISKSNNNTINDDQLSEAIEEDYEELLKACRQADTSADMERLIETKLKRYYHEVHSSFVHSRGFRKNVRAVTTLIRTQPDLVYYNLKTIVDELKVRRKVKVKELGADGESHEANNPNVGSGNNNNDNMASGGSNVASTGNKRTDEQIRKLNKAFYLLNKRIIKLEEAEVDWENDDDSPYVQMGRLKKRACQIYEKICDLTGESKNAHRLAKRPINFSGTAIPQFNRTLQAYINRTREFPDYYDVLRMLEHCNRQYDLNLVNFEVKSIAQDAFLKVGKLLQARRRNDLYETVTHFTANTKDPATVDAALLAKLSENQKQRTKVSDIINKYANLTAEELRAEQEAKMASKSVQSKSSITEIAIENGDGSNIDDDDDDNNNDDDDDEDEEEEEEDICTLDDDVEQWTNIPGFCNVELSDDDDYTEFNIPDSIIIDIAHDQLSMGDDGVKREAEDNINATQSVAGTTATTGDKNNDLFLTNARKTEAGNISTMKSTTPATKLTDSTVNSTATATTKPVGNKRTTNTATTLTAVTESRKSCDNRTANSSKQPLMMRSKTGDDNKPPQSQPNGKLKEQLVSDSSLRIVSVTSLQKHTDNTNSNSNSNNKNNNNNNRSRSSSSSGSSSGNGNGNSSSSSSKSSKTIDIARNMPSIMKIIKRPMTPTQHTAAPLVVVSGAKTIGPVCKANIATTSTSSSSTTATTKPTTNAAAKVTTIDITKTIIATITRPTKEKYTPTTKTTSTTTTATTSANKPKQRTVEEIVISDEES